MLEMTRDENGTLFLSGRFDAAQVAPATEFLAGVTGAAVLDLAGLTYISSAGLGVLLARQKALIAAGGGGLRLVNARPHVYDVFHFSGFDQVFEITRLEP